MNKNPQLLRNRPNQGGLIGLGVALGAFSLVWGIIAILDILGAASAGEAISYGVCAVISGTVAVRVLTKSRAYVQADLTADAVIVRNAFEVRRVPWSQIDRVEMEHGWRRRAFLHLTDGSRVKLDALGSGALLPSMARLDRRAAVCNLLDQRLKQRRIDAQPLASAPLAPNATA
jgi:hypothetical protein